MRSVKNIPYAFSLIELLVTLSILAILASIAVPSYTYVIKRNALVSFHNDLVHALRSARIEAITHKDQPVSLCALSDSATASDPCNTSSAVASGWSKGFVLLKGSGSFTQDSILKYSELPSSLVEVQVSNSTRLISFNALGVRSSPSGSGTVSVSVCDKDDQVVLNKTIVIGMATIEVQDTNGCN